MLYVKVAGKILIATSCENLPFHSHKLELVPSLTIQATSTAVVRRVVLQLTTFQLAQITVRAVPLLYS